MLKERIEKLAGFLVVSLLIVLGILQSLGFIGSYASAQKERVINHTSIELDGYAYTHRLEEAGPASLGLDIEIYENTKESPLLRGSGELEVSGTVYNIEFERIALQSENTKPDGVKRYFRGHIYGKGPGGEHYDIILRIGEDMTHACGLLGVEGPLSKVLEWRQISEHSRARSMIGPSYSSATLAGKNIMEIYRFTNLVPTLAFNLGPEISSLDEIRKYVWSSQER